MERKSKAVSGWVNFPVDSVLWPNSNEGGLVVKLVVVDDRDSSREFAKCAGAHTHLLLSESFVGDDARPRPGASTGYAAIEDVIADQKAIAEWERFHFPNLAGTHSVEDYLSRDYLAAIVLGTTGWSGYSEETGEPWSCTYLDLTEDGRELYVQISRLYPGCSLHLLTFLDT